MKLYSILKNMSRDIKYPLPKFKDDDQLFFEFIQTEKDLSMKTEKNVGINASMCQDDDIESSFSLVTSPTKLAGRSRCE